MLIPNFEDQEEEDDDLFAFPCGKKTYLKNYPKFERSTNEYASSKNLIYLIKFHIM